jgi:ferric-dicitrate binding protein FerR (iron transport regulator)
MSKYSEDPEHGSAEREADALQRLLQVAGRREPPADRMTEQVRAAVMAEWRSVVIERKRRRAAFAMAVAASVLAVVGAWLWSLRPGEAVGASVARVEKIYGHPAFQLSSSPGHGALVLSQDLHVGEALSTGDTDRVALRWRDGASLRLDRRTTISLVAEDRLALQQGAVYIDRGTESENSRPGRIEPGQQGTSDLIIETSAGSIRHLGTQYETRLSSQTLRVSVREGRVEVLRNASFVDGPSGVSHRPHDPQVVEAGERLTIDPDGRQLSQFVSPHDSEWNWIGQIAPTFAIDRQPLKDFLTWVGRELGQEIVFADALSESQAKAVILRGSIDGLTPEQALPAVLSTTRLHLKRRDEKIVIEADRQSL